MNTNKELNYRLYLQREENFIRSDLNEEFSRYDDIKNGDLTKVEANIEAIKKNFYKGKGTLSDNPLRNNIYHLVVCAGVIARICIEAGLPHNEAYTLSDIFIRRADKAKSPEVVIDMICDMQLEFAKKMKELKKQTLFSVHIRHSIDYIYDHLQESLTMEKLAKVEGLNPSYFSSLFAKETGMTTKAYILEVKIKTAKNMLKYSNYPISDIALSLGFSSQSAFTAAFRKITGETPKSYKNKKQTLTT